MFVDKAKHAPRASDYVPCHSLSHSPLTLPRPVFRRLLNLKDCACRSKRIILTIACVHGGDYCIFSFCINAFQMPHFSIISWHSYFEILQLIYRSCHGTTEARSQDDGIMVNPLLV